MKKYEIEVFSLVVLSSILFVSVLFGFYPHPFLPEDYSYEDFSPLEGLAVADERADEINPEAMLIIVQKAESYEFRYSGSGEWSWNYYYQNLSDPLNDSFSYFIVTLYRNQTTNTQYGHDTPTIDSFYPNYPLDRGIENWTVDCEDAVRIIRANEVFADFNRKAPGLEIVTMELIPVSIGYVSDNYHLEWYIHFEGNYDDGFDGMYGTSGYARIDATTGEILEVWVGEGRHAPPCCVVTVIIGTIMELLIAERLVRKIRFNRKNRG